MTKVSYVEVPPELQEFYNRGLQPGDRFTFSRTRIKDLFLSRARVKGVTQKSLLVSLSPVWKSLTTMEQAAWISAGVINILNGFKMFVVDTAARRRAAVAGYATPNDLYQANVGRIEVQSPATGLLIEQSHPLTYYVLKKVPLTRSQYSPVQIVENFSLPVEIAISWHTDLTSLGAGSRARFYIVLYSSYQGQTIETVLEIPFGMSDNWQRASASLSHVKGLLRGYNAFIEVFNATGNLYFDNVSIQHNGENWARDPKCENISQSFTNAFFQVAKHWVAVNPTSGSDFGSFYFTP